MKCSGSKHRTRVPDDHCLHGSSVEMLARCLTDSPRDSLHWLPCGVGHYLEQGNRVISRTCLDNVFQHRGGSECEVIVKRIRVRAEDPLGVRIGKGAKTRDGTKRQRFQRQELLLLFVRRRDTVFPQSCLSTKIYCGFDIASIAPQSKHNCYTVFSHLRLACPYLLALTARW